MTRNYTSISHRFSVNSAQETVQKFLFFGYCNKPPDFFFVYRLINIHLDYSSLMRCFEAFSTMQICEPRRVLYRRQPRKFSTIWRVANFRNYRKHYHRWQIPLEPAFASTTHKMQGTAAKFGAVIDPSEKKTFARGQDYVAASRPTELANLTLLAPVTVNHFSAFHQERHNIRENSTD